MDISAFIMGICPPHRLAWLKHNIDHLGLQEFPFSKKIVAVDEFDGHKIPLELKKYFESKGWIVLVDSHRSRVKTMDNAFSLINSEFIYYNEDDVLSILPKIDDLDRVFKINWKNRNCGMISLTLGGTKFDPKIIQDDGYQFIGDLRYMNDNSILNNGMYNIFQRMETYANNYFFEFPGLFIRTDIFKKCHEIAKHIGGQIEESLTKAYFKLKLDKDYYKCSIAKSNALDWLKRDAMYVNSHCRLLTNLDPNQGNSPYASMQRY